MGIRKFYTLSSLIQAGEEIARDCDTVSFDLFDTLFIRRIHDPDMLKLPVARFIAAKAEAQGLSWSWQRVQKLRDTFEAEQRVETGQKFDDHEACYPDYMGRMLAHIFGPEQAEPLLVEVTDYEMAIENSMLVPRHDLVEWLRRLYESGKKILLVSDIYLPASHLKRLVAHGGFADYVTDVISSADTFLAKASGNAFPLLEKKFSLDRKRWLHVGDNSISDGLRPMEYGLKSLVLHDSSERWRKSIVKRHINYSAGRPLWRGRALQQLMQPHEAENVERPELYIEGYNFLGPMIGGFVQHVAEQSRELEIGKVFFLSREGWTFKRYWEKSMPLLFPDQRLPEIEYLSVSRMALAGAACAYQGLSQVNADITFLPLGNRDFRDVCRIFSLNADAFVGHLQRYDLTVETILSPAHDGYREENRTRFNELLEDQEFQQEVRSQCRPANDAMLRYFEDVGFFDHKRIGLVDIGWRGTIQRFLHQAVSHRADCPDCHGFLFGATRGIKYPTTTGNQLEGVMYDRHHFDFSASALLYARDLFEEACRAPHPTLNGYVLKDEGYELEFRRVDDALGQAEQVQDNYFAPLQEGIFDSAERYGAASAILGYSLEEYKPWLNSVLLNKLAFPRCREIANIRHKYHLDDFHGKHNPSKNFQKGPKELWNASMGWLRFDPLLRLRFFLRHLKTRINE